MKQTGQCVRCGEFTDIQLGGVFICRPCYDIRSSCCPEFGPDDLAASCTESETAENNTLPKETKNDRSP